MKKIIIIGAMFMMTPFVSFAQIAATGTVVVAPTTATTTLVAPVADAGLVPGDFFYFIDRLGEALNTALTFNKEKKARKHIEYAKERVAEMDEVLKKPEAKLDDVADAKDDFDKRIAEAATLVKMEKESGADVADLARELDDELDVSREALKNIFKNHKEKSSKAEEVIQAKLGSLTDSEAPQLKGLLEALSAITKEKQEAANEENDLDINLQDEREIFEEIMGKEMSAEKHFEKAMRLRMDLEDVDGQVPPQESELFMKQAEEAMMRGDFDAAKMMSKEAERVFENAREMDDEFKAGVIGTPVMMNINDNDNDNDNGNDDIDDSDVDNLEQEIRRNEMMMQNLDR